MPRNPKSQLVDLPAIPKHPAYPYLPTIVSTTFRWTPCTSGCEMAHQ